MKTRSHTINNVKSAIKEVGISAKRKAFRLKLPIAVSENGETILLYPDGTRKPFTAKAMADLKNARS